MIAARSTRPTAVCTLARLSSTDSPFDDGSISSIPIFNSQRVENSASHCFSAGASAWSAAPKTKPGCGAALMMHRPHVYTPCCHLPALRKQCRIVAQVVSLRPPCPATITASRRRPPQRFSACYDTAVPVLFSIFPAALATPLAHTLHDDPSCVYTRHVYTSVRAPSGIYAPRCAIQRFVTYASS